MVTMTVTSTMTNVKFGIPLLLGVIITMVAAFLVQQQQQQQKQPFSPQSSSSSSSSRRLLLPQKGLHATTTTTIGETGTHQNHKNIHLVVLVHGWLGSPSELGYLQEELQRQSSSSSTAMTVVHAAECNDGRTSDGIVPGGKRLAVEINSLVDQLSIEYNSYHHQQHQLDITISLVGNSLGGLYARYAVKDIAWGLQQERQQQNPSSSSSSSSMTVIVKPGQFVTTCTPHLGVNKHTYIRIPRFAEEIIGRVLGQTGKDLFQIVDVEGSATKTASLPSSIIHDMTTKDEYLTPLSNFQRRVAFANAYGTDFQVPTSTAAFWEENDSTDADADTSSSLSLHYEVSRTMNNQLVDNQNYHDTSASELVPSNPRNLQVQGPQPPPEVVMILHTKSSSSSKSESEIPVRLSEKLNSLGWTKIVCDVRRHIVTNRLPSLPLFAKTTTTTKTEQSISDPRTFTATELLSLFDTEYGRNIPLGHTIAVANSKDTLNRWITKGGRPIMDYLAKDILSFFDRTEQQQLSQQKAHQMKDDQTKRVNGRINNKKLKSSNSFRQNTVLMAKRGDNDEDQEEESTNIFGKVLAPFTNSPGGMILFPFVVIFGVDILLNTFFLTKRTFEFFVLGQAPSTDTWF